MSYTTEMTKPIYGVAPISPTHRIAAPKLPYKPINPKSYNPPIALIGCGNITRTHLRAYQSAGFNVAAVCDIDQARARERAAEFYPAAAIYTDWRQLLKRDDLEVVDIATHPPVRGEILEA